jgi:glutamyl/glutaminyl-tRNA synthetase
VGRLAPSPTGYLHLGHARTFWIAFERARMCHGRLLLRDEDLDPQRSRVEFSMALREDLAWLGIRWDEEIQQSSRLDLYRSALDRLIAAGLAYPCTCYRFRIASSEPVRFTDLNAGPQSFTPGHDFGDFLLWRKPLSDDPEDIGLPSYQLTCVVDDDATHVTEVVRGHDLLKSTARQILLQRALKLSIPSYYHCELVHDAVGQRLAKRHDALALRTLRERGFTPQQVIAMF